MSNVVTPPPRGYADANTIAKAVGCSAATVRRWYNTGKMPKPATHLGGRWLWKEAVIDQLLNKFADAA